MSKPQRFKDQHPFGTFQYISKVIVYAIIDRICTKYLTFWFCRFLFCGFLSFLPVPLILLFLAIISVFCCCCFSADKRKAEAARIRVKYPDRIPVISEKSEKSDIPDIDKKKYLVPADLVTLYHYYIIIILL